MVPRPPSHPRLRKTKLPRDKKNVIEFCFSLICYLKGPNMVPTWSQNFPPPPSPSPARF